MAEATVQASRGPDGGSRSSKAQGAGGGFTLVELIVVLAVIAILVMVLVPTFSGAIRYGYCVVCSNNLREISKAAAMQVKPDLMGGVSIPPASWVSALMPHAADRATIFVCPVSEVTASAGGGGVLSDHIEAWCVNGYPNVEKPFTLGSSWYASVLQIVDDSPFVIHASPTQRDAWRASGHMWGDGVIGEFPPFSYEPDGSGQAFWGIEWAINNKAYHWDWCEPFMNLVEQETGGGRLWVSWEGRASSHGRSTFEALVSKHRCTTLTNFGPATFDKGQSIAVMTMVASYDPKPNTTVGDLVCGDILLECGPLGADHWIDLPIAAGMQTNYGLNKLAASMTSPGAILVLDYLHPIALTTDDWDTPTYDQNRDGQLDFARHDGKVNVLFVDGSVKRMRPSRINPQDVYIEKQLWCP